MVADKVRILVTGAGRGIGRAVVEALRARGAVVGAMDINRDSLADLADTEGVHVLVGDVSEPASAAAVVEEFEAAAGGIDALVNNAGIVRNAPLINMNFSGKASPENEAADLRIWRQVIETNLGGVFLMTRAVVPCMLRKRLHGVIVNISSVCASGNAGQGAYSAAKAGVEALTVTWAKELGALGIRVAGVAPGFAATETTMTAMTESVIKDWKRATPLRRMATQEEIAQAVLFVLDNDFMHGRMLAIDGGLRL